MSNHTAMMVAATFTAQCPVCNRSVDFSHEATNIQACACGAVLQRGADGNLREKPFYRVQNPADPIQPGTRGRFKGKPFVVLGRIRAWMEEFVFNYWTLLFDDGHLGYLGEGYGQYALYGETQLDEYLSATDLAAMKAGSFRELFPRQRFLLERRYACYKWEVEGECRMPECSDSFSVFEFSSDDGRHIEALHPLGNDYAAFEVFYVDLDELELANLREESPAAKTIECPVCAQPNELKALPFTQSFGCPHCGGRFALHNGFEFKKVSGRNHTDIGPDLKLGTMGYVRGVQYEVIGYMQKEERNLEGGTWKEYTLYNRLHGFAFLSEHDGHWIFVQEKGDCPVLTTSGAPPEFTHGGEPFQLYNKYSASVLNATGSFPYNLFNDEGKDVCEYISPPEMWIRERSKREGTIWYRATHIGTAELERAFAGNIVLPYKKGVGAIQPKGFVAPAKLAIVAFFAALLLLAVHLLTTNGSEERLLVDQNFVFPDSVSNIASVSPEIKLTKWRSNLKLAMFAPVDNSWFELGATLVNTKTGTEYTLAKGVEYYHGFSEGEYWSEGSRNEQSYLQGIPAGTYKLQVQGIREQGISFENLGAAKEFHLRVTYDVPSHRNFFICLLVLLAWPLAQYWLVNEAEKKRWYNSPYSPFTYED